MLIIKTLTFKNIHQITGLHTQKKIYLLSVYNLNLIFIVLTSITINYQSFVSNETEKESEI